ncbi:hypothetical protein Tco_1163374 [Tanacetum coccineum]
MYRGVSRVPEQTTVETVTNMTLENRAHYESEKEAIHLILTGIGDEIYSTVDACQTAQENVGSHRRLQQGNDYQTGQFGNLRVVNVVGLGNLESKKRVRDSNTDEEIDEQELEAHYSYMAKIQEVPNADSGTDAEPLIINTCAVETGDSNVTSDSPDMCDNDIQDDQNDVECDDERVALANLIANLKLDVDENKKIQKQLKKAMQH